MSVLGLCSPIWRARCAGFLPTAALWASRFLAIAGGGVGRRATEDAAGRRNGVVVAARLLMNDFEPTKAIISITEPMATRRVPRTGTVWIMVMAAIAPAGNINQNELLAW